MRKRKKVASFTSLPEYHEYYMTTLASACTVLSKNGFTAKPFFEPFLKTKMFSGSAVKVYREMYMLDFFHNTEAEEARIILKKANFTVGFVDRAKKASSFPIFLEKMETGEIFRSGTHGPKESKSLLVAGKKAIDAKKEVIIPEKQKEKIVTPVAEKKVEESKPETLVVVKPVKEKEVEILRNPNPPPTATKVLNGSSSIQNSSGYVLPKDENKPKPIFEYDGSYVLWGQQLQDLPELFLHKFSDFLTVSNLRVFSLDKKVITEADTYKTSYEITQDFSKILAFDSVTKESLDNFVEMLPQRFIDFLKLRKQKVVPSEFLPTDMCYGKKAIAKLLTDFFEKVNEHRPITTVEDLNK